MAGKWQHYIPQFLLRGFGQEVKGKNPLVWVYRKDGRIFQAPTNKIGAEDSFYSAPSKDGLKTLDDLMTHEEGTRIAPLIKDFCEIPHLGDVASNVATEVVGHFMRRTAAFREWFSSTSDDFIGRISSSLGDESAFLQLLSCQGMYPTDVDERFLLELGIREFSSGEVKGEVKKVFQEKLAEFRENIPHLIRNAHNKALGSSSEEDEKGAILRSLKWRLVWLNNDIFILPDCIALGISSSPPEIFPLIWSDFLKLRWVFLPLSSQRMLVGRSSSDEWPALDDYNWIAAECCEKEFFSEKRSPELEALQKVIGIRSSKVRNDAVSGTFGDL